MTPKRLYTCNDILNLPDFIHVELIDGIIYTDDWTNLVLAIQNLPIFFHVFCCFFFWQRKFFYTVSNCIRFTDIKVLTGSDIR